MTFTGDLYDRGTAIFGSGQDGVFWPYDASGIDRTLRRRDPQRFEQQLAELNRKRLLIVEWAEQYGLKASSVKCCPWWLTRKVSRSCAPGRCTQYGVGGADRSWLDHTICWLKDSKPAVITSAPYCFDVTDRKRVIWWLREDLRLGAASGAGWYGHGTTQVVMWRTDRIAIVDPASPKTGATP